MVKYLLDHGATCNAFDKKDRRALHWAAYMGHMEIAHLLIKHDAELNVRDKEVIPINETHKVKNNNFFFFFSFILQYMRPRLLEV